MRSGSDLASMGARPSRRYYKVQQMAAPSEDLVLVAFQFGIISRKRHTWVKAHLACGVQTNIVTAVRITEKDSHDYPTFDPLARQTRENFTIKEMSADKGYSGRENFDLIYHLGGTAFIAFKENATGKVGGMFEQMFHYYKFKQQEFLDHYHKAK